MPEENPSLMLVAGEASGDRHAADLFVELKRLVPGIKGFGMGGENMRHAGVKICYDSSEIAIIGLDGIVRQYPKILRALRLMKKIVSEQRPDLLICVDYKEFNYKLARYAKSAGIKVLFYVSPQFWAWRPGRITKYGAAIDRMAVIFPFEVAIYEEHGIPVSYVGHPLVDKVHASLSKPQSMEKLALDSSHPVIGLLPGSRINVVKRILPLMLLFSERLSKQYADIQFILLQATSIKDQQIEDSLNHCNLSVNIIKNDTYDAIQCCNAVLTTSGTATLEVALLGIPMAITYRVNLFTYWIGRLLVNIPYIGLPNIIAGRQIIQEFIQNDATPDAISNEMARILTDQAYSKTMIKNLDDIQQKLGSGNGTLALAKVARDML